MAVVKKIRSPQASTVKHLLQTTSKAESNCRRVYERGEGKARGKSEQTWESKFASLERQTRREVTQLLNNKWTTHSSALKTPTTLLTKVSEF